METIIVPLKAVNFELPELMKGLYEQLLENLKAKSQAALNQKLVEIVTEGLGRAFHQRRAKTKGGRGLMQCQRCGTRFWRQFSRNGYRSRYLELALGRLKIELPRVVCQCGESVRLNLEGLKPWQRWGDDVEQLVQHWSALGYSLRQMQRQLQDSWQSGIGLSSLTARLKPLAQPLLSWQKQPLPKTPPVVLLDAIWVKLLIETQIIKKDKRGRRRVLKKRVKRPLLIALGVWPEEGFYQVLDWELGTGPGEDKDSWLALLNRLTQRGLHPDFGLELFVTDGGGGLLAALQETFSHVPRQRCVFHKIHNVLAQLTVPATLSKEEQFALRKQIARQLALIWQAPTRPEAEKRAHQFCQTWLATQPEVVATSSGTFRTP